jgi:hypothetical protein
LEFGGPERQLEQLGATFGIRASFCVNVVWEMVKVDDQLETIKRKSKKE